MRRTALLTYMCLLATIAGAEDRVACSDDATELTRITKQLDAHLAAIERDLTVMGQKNDAAQKRPFLISGLNLTCSPVACQPAVNLCADLGYPRLARWYTLDVRTPNIVTHAICVP